MNILITGATGNIGKELLEKLEKSTQGNFNIHAGVRNVEKAQNSLGHLKKTTFVVFDFEDPHTFPKAFEHIDVLFLLRPPHISNIKKYFSPLISAMSESGIQKVVFLSVQGAEQSAIIPHRKIELLILDSGIEYIFMQPSYFMQNLTTTLLSDVKKGTIVLPSKDALFNWIDIEDIAEIGSLFLTEFDSYKNISYVLTGSENLNFRSVVEKINNTTHGNLVYRSVNPLKFVMYKLKEKIPFGFIIVMFILHYLPTIQAEPEISENVQKLLGRSPTSVDEFIVKNKGFFITE